MDTDLVKRAQGGDQDAFAELAAAVADRFLATSHRILSDIDLAEDATQQALFSIWEDLPQLRDPARFEAWSYRLLVHACYAEGRKSRRWAPNLRLLSVDEPMVAGDLGSVVDRDELERAFRRLSVNHRTVVVLHHYLDLPLERVADIVGSPVGTVSSRLHYAMRTLRTAIVADAQPGIPGGGPVTDQRGRSPGAEPDVRRVVRSWLSEDRHEDATRVLGVVLNGLDTAPQRRSSWSAWRTSLMSKTMKYGLAAAAVVVVAIIGAQLFGSVGPSPGEDPSPSSAPSEAATSNEPSAGGLPVNSILVEGPLLLWDGAPDGVSITVDIAGTEWWGRAGKGWFTNRTDTNGHPGTGMIVFGSVQEYYVYGDPCLWLTTKPETAVTTVDEVVAALKATTSATEADHELLGQWASEITDISVDGYSGKAITLHAPGIFPHMCDADQWAYFATEDDSPERYLDRDGPLSMVGQNDEFWILDVGGSIIILDIGYYSDTPQSVVDELRSMLASATFE